MKLLKYGNQAIALRNQNGELKILFDEIPMYISELINDAGYITKAVDDLNNYYNKNDINDLISNVSHLRLEVVQELPVENINTSIIYLLPNGNEYDEYVYINEKWEVIGTTRIDITNLVTKQELEETLSKFTPSGDPILYGIPLDETRWLRIAKVKDTSKISSGIFTFNCYGIKADETKEVLNAVTFSVNAGVDKKKEVFGDILPLSVSPDMTGTSSSDGSVDTPPSSASVVSEEGEPAVASEDEIAVVSSGGGSGGGSSFGLANVTLEEYEDEVYVCGLISFPNVDYYTAFEVELIIENSLNFETLETFEPVDLTLVDYKGKMTLLEGMEIKKYTDYEYIIKGKLTDYVEAVKNKKPLHIDIEYEGNEEQLDKTSGFDYFHWGFTYIFTRDKSLDTTIDDVQYYGYTTTDGPLPGSDVTSLLVTDNPVTTSSTVYYITGEVHDFGSVIEKIYEIENPNNITLVKYTEEILEPGFVYNQWGNDYAFTRDTSLDTIINDVQYYGYTTTDGPISGSNATSLLVTDNPVTTSSTLYFTTGEIHDFGGSITDVYGTNGETKVDLVVKNKDIYLPSNKFGVAFVNDHNIYYDNYYSIYAGDVNNVGQFFTNLVPFILEFTDGSKIEVQSSDYTVYFRHPKKIKISVNTLFGMEGYNLKLNDEFINFSIPYILDLEEDILSLECVGDNYGGINIYVYIDDVDYEIRIPYELEDNKVVKQYTIAENNPYNVSLMIEEYSKHTTTDKYSMQSIYKQLDNLEYWCARKFSDYDTAIMELECKALENLPKVIPVYLDLINSDERTDAKNVIEALFKISTEYVDNEHCFILLNTRYYIGNYKYNYNYYLVNFLMDDIELYTIYQLEFTPLTGPNSRKKYHLKSAIDNSIDLNSITDDMFEIIDCGGVTEEYVNQAITNAITNVLEAEY